MPYATLDDINARYPGELAQAGPKTAAGAVDEDAENRRGRTVVRPSAGLDS